MTKESHILPDHPFEQIETVLRTLKNTTKAVFREKKFGITLDQWAVLKSISEAEFANQSYLATSTHKDPAAITRMIELLIKRELVHRKEQKADRRAYHVKLTRKGAGMVKRVAPIIEQIRTEVLKEISERDLSTIKRISGKILEGLG